MSKVARLACGILAVLGLGCGPAEIGGETPIERVGEIQSAATVNTKYRAAAAMALTQNGQLQQWVVVCGGANKLHHRVKIGTGNWGAWVNDNLPCTGGVTGGPWRSGSNDEASVYYRNNNNLMETVYRVGSSILTVNLSTYISGFGQINTDPVLSYYDLASGQIGVVAQRTATGKLTAIDYYSGAWHHSPISTGVTPANKIKAFFSVHTGGVRHLIVQLGTSTSSRFFTKVGATGSYTERFLFSNWGSEVNFGGFDDSICRTGCLMYMATPTSGRWAPIGNWNTSTWEAFHTLGIEVQNVGWTRSGGDANYGFFNEPELNDDSTLFRYGYYTTAIGTAAVAAPRTLGSMPMPVTNVLDGSIYDSDAYFTVKDTSGFHHLYRTYNNSIDLMVIEDMNMTVLPGT
jgi:hypothetical protein